MFGVQCTVQCAGPPVGSSQSAGEGGGGGRAVSLGSPTEPEKWLKSRPWAVWVGEGSSSSTGSNFNLFLPINLCTAAGELFNTF